MADQQQGLSLSEEKIFSKIGKLTLANEQLSEMLAASQQKLQQAIDQNDNLKKEIESLKKGGKNSKMKIVSEN